MGIIKIVSTVKKVHNDSIVLVKIGSFYHAYGKDAYILSALFGYKIKKVEDTFTCGFNSQAKAKVISKLEDKKINYIILDRRNNYDVDEKMNFKNLNTYEKNYNKARPKVNAMKRIEQIYEYLNKNIDDENISKILTRIEEVISEGREI